LNRALADLRRARTAGTVALYAAIAAVALLLIAVPLCRPLQGELARAHHLRPSSLPAWTALQVVPKMYSFAHQVRAEGDDPLWVNHYPVRVARFERARAEIVARGEEVHLEVRSEYRGSSWLSRLVVRVEGGGLVLAPVEGAR
jgi:hypothetical protein